MMKHQTGPHIALKTPSNSKLGSTFSQSLRRMASLALLFLAAGVRADVEAACPMPTL